MGKVGFYINHGVEVRYFLLSGLVDICRKNNDVCLYTFENHSNVLKEYAKTYNIEIKTLPPTDLKTPRFEAYQRAFINARKRANDVSIYNHFGNLPGPKFYDNLFKIPILSRIGNAVFRKKTKKYYKNELLIDFLKNENLEKMYLLQYDSAFLKLVGINSALAGAKVNVFINTLKMVFIDDFVTIPINRLFSWNPSQNKLFQKANVGIENKNFEAKGSPFHTFLRNKDLVYQKIVKEKYNIDSNRPLVLYSLINEKVFDKEDLIIESMSVFFEESFKENERPLIVVRRNPFEVSDNHVSYISKLKNVIVADHLWERNEERNWSIQRQEGELEWRALLQIANLTINIPSMSTIDSIMCGTPVLNVGYSETGEYNDKLDFIIDSPFNLYLEKCEFVKTARTKNEFEKWIIPMIGLKKKHSYKEIVDSLDISKCNIQEYS